MSGTLSTIVIILPTIIKYPRSSRFVRNICWHCLNNQLTTRHSLDNWSTSLQLKHARGTFWCTVPADQEGLPWLLTQNDFYGLKPRLNNPSNLAKTLSTTTTTISLRATHKLLCYLYGPNGWQLMLISVGRILTPKKIPITWYWWHGLLRLPLYVPIYALYVVLW